MGSSKKRRSKTSLSSTRSGRPRSGGPTKGKRPPRRSSRPRRLTRRVIVPTLVVGEVPLLTRLAGGLAVIAALLTLVRPAFPLVTTRGDEVGGAASPLDFIAALPIALGLGVAGVYCILGRLPRFYLAVIAAIGAVSAGQFIQTVYLYGSAERTSRDLLVSEAAGRTFTYDPSAGLVVLGLSQVCAVLALVLVIRAWPRTVMEDDESFARFRSLFGGVGLFVGFLAAATVYVSPADAESTDLAPGSILQRQGLFLVGGLIVGGILVLCAVVAPALRPRLATVGMYIGLSLTMLSLGLANSVLVGRSDVLRPSLGSFSFYVAALTFAGLALVIHQMTRWEPANQPVRKLARLGS